MSEREDVAAKRNKCLGAQQAFREALAALEALPQQLTALAGRTTSQALPPEALSWSEPAPISKSSTVAPGKPHLLHCPQTYQGFCYYFYLMTILYCYMFPSFKD